MNNISKNFKPCTDKVLHLSSEHKFLQATATSDPAINSLQVTSSSVALSSRSKAEHPLTVFRQAAKPYNIYLKMLFFITNQQFWFKTSMIGKNRTNTFRSLWRWRGKTLRFAFNWSWIFIPSAWAWIASQFDRFTILVFFGE